MVTKYQVGEIIINKTREYLNPLLRLYGLDFLKKIRKLYCVGSGIGDMIYSSKTGYKHEHHLFLLFDVNLTDGGKSLFGDVIDYLRNHSSYETDYVYDDITAGSLHMIVLRLPEGYEESIDHFKKSKYSKILDKKVLEVILDENSKAFKVISKNSKYRVEFEKEINSKSKHDHVKSRIELPDDAELDYRVDLTQEIFRIKN
jgi:hypothetical protein